MMIGACHHLSPAWVIIDNRLKAPFSSIAGAKIRRFSVSTKFWYVIRSDFQQTYDLKVSYKDLLYVLRGASLCFALQKTMFLVINQHITKVITDYG